MRRIPSWSVSGIEDGLEIALHRSALRRWVWLTLKSIDGVGEIRALSIDQEGESLHVASAVTIRRGGGAGVVVLNVRDGVRAAVSRIGLSIGSLTVTVVRGKGKRGEVYPLALR